MTNEIKPANPTSNGGFEPSDIPVAGVLFFLAGLLVAGLIVHFVATGLFSVLEKRAAERQTPISPLVTNAPTDTRHIPRDYPQSVFPNPKLEEDERGQLNGIRLSEEQTLSTYDWVDENAGIVRIPIDRAMDLLAQRGLPTRAGTPAQTAASSNATATGKKEKQ